MIKILIVLLIGLITTTEKVAVERDGIVVIEAESVALGSGWKLETDSPGYSGDGYITWDGENMYDKPGTGENSYHVHIHNPGTYYLQLRNYHNDPDPTECNDLFVKINDGEWIKTYSHVINQWNWHTGFDIQHVWGMLPKLELKAGPNTIFFSGRSKGFSIDRLVLVIAEKLALDAWQHQTESDKRDQE